MLPLSDDTGYIGEFEIVDDHRAGKIVVEVRHRLGLLRRLVIVFLGCF